jgi:single-strand DNA-binding protein
MYLNEIKLIGFVGQDAEAKSSQNSKELVRFEVATKASWKNRDSGEYDSRNEWHRIVAWSNLTKFAQTLKKGEHVHVSGELRYREYEKAVGEGKNTFTMPVAEIHARRNPAARSADLRRWCGLVAAASALLRRWASRARLICWKFLQARPRWLPGYPVVHAHPTLTSPITPFWGAVSHFYA